MMHYENEELKRANVDRYLKEQGIADLDEAKSVTDAAGIDVRAVVRGIQPICFEDAVCAYTAGTAAALRKGITDPSGAALEIGRALQAFCADGSVAQERQVGIGHGKLAAKVLSDDTKCFCFLAGHESFAAAGGAIGIAGSANQVRKTPLRVILNGLGKDAAEIISRFNGFTYVRTDFDYASGKLRVVSETPFSGGPARDVRVYGANDVREGIEIMKFENVDVSITGNGTNMVRFSHIVAGGYKQYCSQTGRSCFACASGGGIGRTLGPDETSAGPASYGLTDSMSRMWGDTTFAGSSSVPAHVEMMGFIGMGNNPMVGATVALAVKASEAVRRA